jgi:hypothetical protein
MMSVVGQRGEMQQRRTRALTFPTGYRLPVEPFFHGDGGRWEWVQNVGLGCMYFYQAEEFLQEFLQEFCTFTRTR